MLLEGVAHIYTLLGGIAVIVNVYTNEGGDVRMVRRDVNIVMPPTMQNTFRMPRTLIQLDISLNIIIYFTEEENSLIIE